MPAPIKNNVLLDFSDVLIQPRKSDLSSRKQVSLNREIINKNKTMSWTGIPIMAANMDTTGTPEMAIALAEFDMPTALSKYADLSLLENHIAARKMSALSFGMTPEDYYVLDLPGAPTLEDLKSKHQHNTKILDIITRKREHLFESVYSANDYPFICLDVANGYMDGFLSYVQSVRKRWSNKIIIAGNVVTFEQSECLCQYGSDIVKVGIGPGSVCTTRKMTGIGYPQLSAIMDCKYHWHIMSDGGCTCPGDVSKAFCAGASMVMLGGMLAGHDECLGEIIEVDGQTYKKFYGMSSSTAMRKYNGGVAEYRASEGKEVLVPYRGPVSNTIREILGGVRSTCTYIGAKNVKEMPDKAIFNRVNRQLNNVFGV
jgi:GMP reductase